MEQPNSPNFPQGYSGSDFPPEKFMPKFRDISHKSEEKNLKCNNKLIYPLIMKSQIIKPSHRILDIKRILKRRYSENQSNLIYNKIMKRIRNLPPCAEK